MANPVIVQARVVCSAPLHLLWSALADTERLNRAIGNKAVAMTAKSDATATRYLARTNLGGFNVTYDERPYEWVYLKRFDVLRRMHNGPVTELHAIYEFEALPEGKSAVTIRLELVPRLAVLAPIVRLSSARGVDRIAAEVREIDRTLTSGEALPRVPAQPAVKEQALARVATALQKKADPALVERLVALVREGGDLDVGRIRPFELAQAWGIERLAALRLCLHAAKAGLLELRWAVICPSCRVPSETLPTLADLKEHGACQICDLSFAVELDDAVEATFAPSPAVRPIDEGRYCIGGPARTPHVIAQAILPPGGKIEMLCSDEAGRYRLFVRGGARSAMVVTNGGAQAVDVDASQLPPTMNLAPGAVLGVFNGSGNETHCKIERVEHAENAASARIVTALAEFRRDFSSDVLRPGSSFKLSRVALLFSDLASSTQLYAEAGDGPAYKIVQDHFDLLLVEIARHDGAQVKTIGDAVMAVFSSDLDAVRAGLAILRAFTRFRDEKPERQRTDIKLGMYSGPCFAITANGAIDYFGQTANIAARLQSEAHAGEFVIPEALATEAIGQGLLQREMVIERYRATLKGVTDAVAVCRVRIAPPR